MRIALVAVLMAFSLAWDGPAASAQQNADHLGESGVAVAVGWEEGTLLLQNSRGFPLVVVDSAAAISDARGATLTLAEIQPGDHVEYSAESWGSMSLATTLRVTSPRKDDHH